MELVDILNENGEKTYTSTSREEAHLKGLWHRNVGLLVSYRENEENYLIFSERAQDKKSFPGLLDLTSSGHLSKGEGTEEGYREFIEELGSPTISEGLTYVGDFKLENSYQLGNSDYYNREHLSLFYKKVASLDGFSLDSSEVARLIAVKEMDLPELLAGNLITAYHYNGSLTYLKKVNLKDFLPSDSFYMESIIKKMISIL